MKCRWFFAHAKQTPDDVIDAWTATLCERLSSVDVEAVVTPGRDDYMKRSRAMGGWNTWVKDVPMAEDWSGAPLFHGIVVPVLHLEQPAVGRATFALVEGFLARGKYAYAWVPDSNQIAAITGIEAKDTDAWTDVGVLHTGESA
jgi:hypothetical protein